MRFVAGLDGNLWRLKHLGQNSPRKEFYDKPVWAQTVQAKPYLAMVPEICRSGAKRPTYESKAVENTFAPYIEWLLIDCTPAEAPELLRRASAHISEVYERTQAFFSAANASEDSRADSATGAASSESY